MIIARRKGGMPLGTDRPQIIVRQVTDPEKLARAEAQDERFGRNLAWSEAHCDEVFALHRGKYVCVAGQEPFVAGTVSEAIALAKAAHPDDDGRFLYHVPKEKMAWIYVSRS